MNKAYLTIDDGPSTQFLEKLAFLEELNIKAIWFCQGNFMEQRPEMVVQALQAGHIIGNHSYSHYRFSELTTDQCFAEIRSTHAIIEQLYEDAGVIWDKKYFRFPFADDGSGTDTIERLVHNALAATPERAEAVQSYLRQLGYEQANFENINYPFYGTHLENHIDVFITYDTGDWRLAREETEDGQETIHYLLARMDVHEPEKFLNLNTPNSNVVPVLHDHDMHPQNLSLFKQLILKFLDKGFVFDLPQ